MINNSKYIRQTAIFPIIYGLLIIVGAQLFVSYLYKALNEKTATFITNKIENEKIIGFDTLHYTPGKGNYTEMVTSSHNNYPLFIDNSKKILIELNSTINKTSNSDTFEISNSFGNSKIKILGTKHQENFLRLLFLVATMIITISVFSKHGINLITLVQNYLLKKS